MSDFLTRVAERALGTAPRIDPQSASRYAPARLPLPESPMPEMTTSAAPITPPRDAYAKPPSRRSSSPPSIVTPAEQTVSNAPDNVPALQAETDRSTEEPETGAGSIELRSKSSTQTPSPSKSVAQRTSLDSQPRSLAEGNGATVHADAAFVPEEPSNGISLMIAAPEAPAISGDAGRTASESGSFRIQETNRRTSDGYVSAPKETASSLVEDEPQTAALVSGPSMNHRDAESKTSMAADSIRPSTTPDAPFVQDDRQPAMASDHHPEARGAISAEFVRPATARVDHSNYERAEQSEPSIRVTIGRVEVRSAPPPPVVEPVAPPAPKLSLAEFLRQHNERRR